MIVKGKVILTFIINVFLPLLIGAMIYIFYRPNVWFIKILHIDHFYIHQQMQISFFKKLIIYSGPDFCWAYSFTSAILIGNTLFRFGSFKQLSIFIFSFLILTECLQLFLKRMFTFSIEDLFAVILAFSLSYFIIRRLSN